MTTPHSTQGPGHLVLAVEDEPLLRRFLRSTLVSRGYRVLEADQGAEAKSLARQWAPDLVLLDLGLPDIDGLAVAEDIRSWSSMPIIVLSSRGREEEKVDALDRGANDYLTKPFGVEELLARVRVQLRAAPPSGGPPRSVFESGVLRVDLAQRRVTLAGQPVKLTPIELKLLSVLVSRAGEVVPHEELLTRVWGPSATERLNYLRVHMSHLRGKLELTPGQPSLIETVASLGYRLTVLPS